MKYIQKAIEKFLDLDCFLPIWLASFIPSLSIYLTTGLDPFMEEKQQQLVIDKLPEEIWVSPSFLFIIVLSFFLTLLSIQIGLKKAKGEESIPFLKNLNETFEIIGPSLVTGLLYIIILIPMGLLIAVTLGLFVPVLVWFGIATSLWTYVVVNEKSAGWTPIARSISLVKGKWWSFFGILILVGIITGLGGMVLHSIGVIVNRPLGIALGTALAPMQILTISFIYLELKSNKKTTSPVIEDI